MNTRAGFTSTMSIQTEAIVVIKKLFTSFDKNEDGHLNKSELGAFLKALDTPMTRAELNDAFRQLDGDGSGKITCEEFIAFWTDDNTTRF